MTTTNTRLEDSPTWQLTGKTPHGLLFNLEQDLYEADATEQTFHVTTDDVELAAQVLLLTYADQILRYVNPETDEDCLWEIDTFLTRRFVYPSHAPKNSEGNIRKLPLQKDDLYYLYELQRTSGEPILPQINYPEDHELLVQMAKEIKDHIESL
jgi:hypothetical protein